MNGCDPIVSCTLWEDERTVAMQVLVEGHVVARRADNDWVNATKIVNMVPGMTRGKRDTVLKTRFSDSERMIFRRGALHLKGVWVPLQDAAELAQEYDLHDRLYPLFEDNIRSFLFRPVNKERTRLLVVAARERAALCRMPDASSGLSQDLREELRIRGEELERLLQYLEKGLGVPGPSGSSSAQAGARSSAGDQYHHGVVQEQPHVYVAHAPGSLGAERRPSPTASIVGNTCEPTLPPTPPTPPPSGGFLRSPRQQQGLAATYRTRFGYPPDGPPPPDYADGRSSSGSRLPASSTEHAHPEQGPSSPTLATSSHSLSQRPHTAPASALDCLRRSSIDSTSGPSFSWFDNTTPPEQSLDEYFASASMRSSPAPRRRSHDSSAGFVASLRSPPASHSASPLAGFSAPRSSVGCAVDVVGSRIPASFGADSHFASRSAGPSALALTEQEHLDRTILYELLGGRDVAAEPARDAHASHALSTLPDADVSPFGDSIPFCQPVCDGEAGVGHLCAPAPHAGGAALSCTFPPAADLATSTRPFLASSAAPGSHKRTSTVADAYPSVACGDDGAHERAGHARSSKKARLAPDRGGEASRPTS